MSGLTDRVARHWPLLALVASAAMLAAAHAFETFGHMVPCELCLKAREVYWAALAVAGAGVLLRFTTLNGRRLICAILALTFLGGFGLAVYHAGVEWKFWPGPASCSASGGAVSAADLAKLLSGGPRKPPACDKPAWVFLGLSMAGWNALVSLGLGGVSGWSAMRSEP